MVKNLPTKVLFSIATFLFSAAALVHLKPVSATIWLVVLGSLCVALGLVWLDWQVGGQKA